MPNSNRPVAGGREPSLLLASKELSRLSEFQGKKATEGTSLAQRDSQAGL